MLVSAITSLVTKNNNNGVNSKNGHAQAKTISYDRKNYFGSKKDNTQLVNEDMFQKIALWKEFCEKQLITDESQTTNFDYLA